MKFTIEYPWISNMGEREINTLEELEKLYREEKGYPLIIDFDEETILVYNDYIE